MRLGPQTLRLRPLPDVRRRAAGYCLSVEPAPLAMHWHQDSAGNWVARVLLPGPVLRWSIEASLELDMTPRNPFDFLLDPEAAQWPLHYAPGEAEALLAYRRADQAGAAMKALRDATAMPMDTVGFVLALAAAVRDRIAYVVRMEAGVWPPERSLGEGMGSCRDSAWVLVQALRLHGIAARFASGYLVQFPADDGRDAAELHAWAEAYLPGAGWIGLDATSGLMTAEGHVGLAASATVEGASPLSGTVEPAEARLETSIAVRRL